MKKPGVFLSALFGISLICSHIAAFANTKALPSSLPFSRIVLFGDSLSDQRDMFYTTSILNHFDKQVPIIPDPNYYYQGRFSNGPTWIENVAQNLELQLQNNAWGGATINDSLSPPSMMPQLGLDKTIKNITKNNTSSLYVFWFGANDYLNGTPSGIDPQAYVSQTVATFDKYLDQAITEYGMKYVLVVNMPDLAKTPRAIHEGPAAQQMLANITQWHNDGLSLVIEEEKMAHPGVKIVLMDTQKEMDDEIANPQSYGLTNVTDACLHSKSGQFALTQDNQKQLTALSNARLWNQPKFKGINVSNNGSLFAAYKIGAMKAANDLQTCGDYAAQDQYMFWDDIHPTRVEHKILANKAIDIITQNFASPTK